MMNAFRTAPYWALSILVSVLVLVEVLSFNGITNLQPAGSALSVSTFYIYCVAHIGLLGVSAIWFGRLTKDYYLFRYGERTRIHWDKIHGRYRSTVIPRNLDYQLIPGLPDKTRITLTKAQPITLGQASAITGVETADILVVLLYLKSGIVQTRAVGRYFGVGIVVTGVSSTVFFIVIPLVSDLGWKAEWHLFFSDVFSRLLFSL